MDIEVKNAVIASGSEAQYDGSAKRLLGQKIILAHILVSTVKEFNGMKPEDVVPYIEGNPYISSVPVEPGLTNSVMETGGKRITGFNTENSEIKEGLIRFDIVFYVHIPSRGSSGSSLIQIIVNVEAQKGAALNYHLLNRAIFYVCRLVSSQKGRDFENSNYDDIKGVYSIWVCMNMDEDSMVHVKLDKEQLLGSYDWHGNMDMVNIVMIGFAKEPAGNAENHGLHRLLGVLLSDTMKAEEKFNVMGNEYGIPVDMDIRRDVDIMCNLSQGIMEKGEAIGREKGEAIGREKGEAIGFEKGETIGFEKGRKESENKFIISMHKRGYSLEEIAGITEKGIDEIKTIVRSQSVILV